MHVHILGICGTFMGGIAALAKSAGHHVTGSDANVYPPMSTQLRDLGIDIHEGFDADQLTPTPDVVVVGNVMSRGVPVIEALLDAEIPYQSGPQWLANHVLRGQHVIAVAGTHGKTTTASLVAWILEDAGLAPGFLIGGVPANFGVTARFGDGRVFVVEADEYDTAFFDKRAKFVHYRPRTLVLNNLEFDHADIYRDLDAIQWQFHQLLRTVPRSGRVLVNAADDHLATLIDAGCWTSTEHFGLDQSAPWWGEYLDATERRLRIHRGNGEPAETRWSMGGRHNLENAVAAVSAACHAGVRFHKAVEALGRFDGIRRRMERTATVGDIAIYDDFAHHPTAIRRTLAGVRRRFPDRRILVAMEPRSNTMKMGVHNATLADSLSQADAVWVYRDADMADSLDAALKPLGDRLSRFADYDLLVSDLAQSAKSGDAIIFMSNGGFGGARQTLTSLLQRMRS
ncbi:MAG: UDP-N-acetylmuramate:L-alanyl-gamma-D-glutamyl-meso-diaminopimelate ligase [Pseudomonadota bacterium]